MRRPTPPSLARGVEPLASTRNLVQRLAESTGMIPATAPTLGGGIGQLVLVAEDNPVNQKVLVRLLQQRGHTVEAVVTGQLAVEAIQRQAYDLILMDCQMPGMDGFEATEKIRQHENEGNTTATTLSYDPVGSVNSCGSPSHSWVQQVI